MYITVPWMVWDHLGLQLQFWTGMNPERLANGAVFPGPNRIPHSVGIKFPLWMLSVCFALPPCIQGHPDPGISQPSPTKPSFSEMFDTLIHGPWMWRARSLKTLTQTRLWTRILRRGRRSFSPIRVLRERTFGRGRGRDLHGA